MGERSFGPDTTADEVVAGVDLAGRRVIVTGASGGLGAETSRALASRGAAVTITARDRARGEKVAAEIRSSTGNPDVDVMALELAEPDSVRSFAQRWLAVHSRLDVLVNNAGIMACPLSRTARGWELQFATNHLGHFLLTACLAPALRAADAARVVSLSSAGHRFSPMLFEDIHFESRPYDKWEAYGQSKTANVLFAVELDRRARDLGIRAFAVHPGAIVTDLGRHLDRDDIATLQARAPGGKGLHWKTVPAGAATSVWAATAAELEGRGGIYLEDCGVAEPRRLPDQLGGVEDYAVDPAAARRLWTVSEDHLGERFEPDA